MEVKKDKLLSEIKKAKEGKQTAFNFLLDSFWGNVYNFQLKKINNDEDAEDITIQTFSKAFDKINTFDEQYQFKTWLIAISKNVYIDFLRKKKSSISIETTKEQEETVYAVVDDAPSPEDKIITEQNLAKLLQDIKKLKPKYQEVIQLRFFQELSYKEISEQINEPMNNVKVKLLRAKKLLAEIIKKS
ncbi:MULTISPECIES: RNA polymerase sigma factor [Tenacibaculum]|uniref:RNA polymerase sigma factor n=1 Tax=Tenacibaculum TaxID=104267 RepID=UPI001F0B09DD|nr:MULTISPECIES: sigma-70 family RNA polymerase sigma factor [Tenacibaculum]MCH3882694.1 sigma-70 family RNA polymerase sigma factor [Tenacibaculum aquimarinum]MDO6600275.1 sigma-70 family RNA polymerase sigma factor [Tenacibaculum sp. 1_MG-2023]